MKPEDKHKLVNRLMGQRMKGDEAARQWELLRPLFETLQARYTAELIEKTVTDGEVYHAAAWKMVALNDAFLEMERDMVTGREAVREINKLAEETGPEAA